MTMRLIMVRENGRFVQRTIWADDRPIERQEGPRVRHEESGCAGREPTRVTLPKITALSDVTEPPRAIRFAPPVTPVDPVKMRNLAMIRKVGRMLERAG